MRRKYVLRKAASILRSPTTNELAVIIVVAYVLNWWAWSHQTGDDRAKSMGF